MALVIRTLLGHGNFTLRAATTACFNRFRTFSTVGEKETIKPKRTQQDECSECSNKAKKEALAKSLDIGLKAASYALNTQNYSVLENLACSPFSISAMLNKLCAGSKGGALQQLLGMLQCGTLEEVNAVSKLLMRIARPRSVTGESKLSFVNGAWFDPRFPVDSYFRKVLQNVHKSQVEEIDFNKPDELLANINSWVDEKTQGIINQILTPDDIQPDTLMILADALYFKGTWAKPFDPSHTKTFPFQRLDGQTVQVPFMREYNEHYEYGSYQGFKVLRLPYKLDGDADMGKNRTFSMYIFLPKEIDGLEKLMKEINLNTRMFEEEVKLDLVEVNNLWIPKFDFVCDVKVSELLKDMGLRLPRRNDPEAGVWSSGLDLVQKCRIKIDEKGTEAANVPYMVCGFTPCPEAEPVVDFIADRPFMFMIREDKSGTIFFVGTMLRPYTC